MITEEPGTVEGRDDAHYFSVLVLGYEHYLHI
jgi:hypothetical protein